MTKELNTNININDVDNVNNVNINRICLPCSANDYTDYISKLKGKFKDYIKQLDSIPNLQNDVKEICEVLINVIEKHTSGDTEVAKDLLVELLKKYINNQFWCTGLDKSYAFRGMIPFKELQTKKFNTSNSNTGDINNDTINLYRGRFSKEKLLDKKELLHIPFNKKDLVREQRFSLEKNPCLYLGASSYVCWRECKNKESTLNEFYISGFKLNGSGRNLKIFNLVCSQYLISGICSSFDACPKKTSEVKTDMIRLFPIVIATSFVINDTEPNRERFEYIISHLIMESLQDLDVDGVAYLSKKCGQKNVDKKKCEQDIDIYPYGVNLAIPAYNLSLDQQYGKICDYFDITKPDTFTNIIKENGNNKCSLSSSIWNESNTVYTYKTSDKTKSFYRCDNNISSKSYSTYDK